MRTAWGAAGPGAAVAWLALCVAFGLAYLPTVVSLAGYFSANDMYSYGFLVPFISGYLIWQRRDALASRPMVPSYGFGVTVLGAGLTLLVVGRLSNTNLIEQVSLPVSLCGMALVVLGGAATRQLAFPLAYLFTMVPFWDFLTLRLHLPFQLYSAAIGTGMLQLVGVPVFRDDVLIRLPNTTLEVAEACSGVNHVVAVLCIGVPMTYLYVADWRKRVGILASAVLIALVCNAVRVAIVALYAYFDIRAADGDVHGPYALFRSLLITAIGFLVLFWLVYRLADQPAAHPHAEPNSPRAPWRPRMSAVALAAAMLAGAAALTLADRVEAVPLTVKAADFPDDVGRWRKVAARPWMPPTDAISFDTEVSMTYADPSGASIDVLVGYFEKQTAGRELVGYEMSRVVWPGVRGVASATAPAVEESVVTTRGGAYLVTTWYVVNGRVLTGGYQAKWWTAWTALTQRRSNGGIVAVRTRLRDGESTDAASARTRDFVNRLMTISERYFQT
jgi:EpsI family protein